MRELRLAASRRRASRIAAPDGLEAVVKSIGCSIRVRDLSVGGFAALTPAFLPLDSIHTVQLRLGAITVTVRARTAHCRRLVTSQKGTTYLTGFAVVGGTAEGEPTMDDLVDRVMATSLSFSLE